MTPQALMMGFEGVLASLVAGRSYPNNASSPQTIPLNHVGSDAETIDTGTVDSRYQGILQNKTLLLNGTHRITYDMDRDMVWRWDQVLPEHPNGMRFSVFNSGGDLLATNEYYSVGGGFGML